MPALPGFLDQTMTVYTRNPSGGAYDVQVATGIACRLQHVARQPAASGGERRDLAANRTIHFDDAFIMGEDSQIEIAGPRVEENRAGTAPARWNVQRGTLAIAQLPDGSPSHRRAEVVRA